MFAAGDLALYFGLASEAILLRAQNPNLNFAASPVPQVRGVDRNLTFGRVYALAFPRSADNGAGAIAAAYILAAKDTSAMLAEARGTPSPRRDVLAQNTGDEETAGRVFRNAALVARAWLDPDPEQTDAIFKGMIERVTTGVSRLTESIGRADQELTDLLSGDE
jgi:hypothetical protein